MIFVTVGEQLPFDRLIRVVDTWAATSGEEVFAQTGVSSLKPMHIAHKEFLGSEEFREKFQNAEVIVAHAGMGTIISALELGKAILVMPRQASLGEVRNDHQTATAKRFQVLNYVSVAMDEKELSQKLNNFKDIVKSQKGKTSSGPSPLLIKTIRDFIEAG
jgi:UDP-N-acetylglucosamine transferase subunit ALG13